MFMKGASDDRQKRTGDAVAAIVRIDSAAPVAVRRRIRTRGVARRPAGRPVLPGPGVGQIARHGDGPPPAADTNGIVSVLASANGDSQV